MAELGETLLGGLARGVDGDDATAARERNKVCWWRLAQSSLRNGRRRFLLETGAAGAGFGGGAVTSGRRAACGA